MKHKTCSFWGFAVSQTTKPKAKSVDSTKDDTKKPETNARCQKPFSQSTSHSRGVYVQKVLQVDKSDLKPG